MIRVTNLKKKFGSTNAVDGISFEISQGQVVGFLGPNGAGKSTTMRLLTGYLPPDDGDVEVLGLKVSEDSLSIRKRLGYIPENNPLPDDMEVSEYLHFVAQLRGLTDFDIRLKKVKEVVKSCSLKGAIGKKLSELSKGYRQRVGLAQAIVHDPDVLVLDEPTSGLDPNQVQEVRGLISNLKSQKTLLISTHILSEVQQTCDRIIVINKGKIVGDGSPTMLTQSLQNLNRLFVALKGSPEAIERGLLSIPNIQRLEKRNDTQTGEAGFVIESASEFDLRENVFYLAKDNNWPILKLSLEKLSLEDVFKALTKDDPQAVKPNA